MPFKKGTCGNSIVRTKGSVSTNSKLIVEHIIKVVDGKKII